MPPAETGTTLVDHLRRQVRDRADSVAMSFRAGRRWAPITWSQLGVAARRFSSFLLEEGVGVGDHVAIWSGNRPEWHIADAGILSVRARPVPVYQTLTADQAAYVLGHSDALVLVVESPAYLEKALSLRERLPSLRRVVVVSGLDSAREDGFVLPWATALQRGEDALQARGSALERLAAETQPDDVATLIYTSGTTGPPKAVMLTHRNVLAALAGVTTIVGAEAEDRVVSYLPLAHVAERINSEFRSYLFGNVTYFATSIDTLADDLREVRPTMFFAVPRVWEKMAGRISAQVEGTRGPRGRLARWALRTGARAAVVRESGGTPSILLRRRLRVADRLVLARIRAATGLEQSRILASGAAPIGIDTLRFFAALGMDVCEAYGQTENTGTATLRRPGSDGLGTVGQPYPGVELRIADDGEILVRGDVVFPGYFKDQSATAEALEDGWLHTGDVGVVDSDGALRITDRMKDLIITAGGKNIAPTAIESALTRHPLVANAVAIGDRRPYVTALLTLDESEVERRSAAADSPTAQSFMDELQAHVDAVNRELGHVERVKRWRLLDADFRVGDELTPTLKVKRKVVAEKYASEIETMYATPVAGARDDSRKQ